MNKTDKRKLNKYFWEIHKNLICSINMKFAFTHQLRNEIKDIVEAIPGIDFDGIVQIIGTPQEISKTFEDDESLRKIAKRLVILETITLVILVIAIIYIIFQSYYFGGEIYVNSK